MVATNRKIYIVLAVLLLLVLTVAAAYVTNQQKNTDAKSAAAPRQYVCSMHPEVLKDSPGDCPVCGMVLVEKISQAQVSEKKQYVCSMHPEVLKDSPGDCPVCGMVLIEKIRQESGSADSLLCDVVRPVNESVLAQVATVHPAQENLPLIIETLGTINYDPRNIHTISARFKGLVERSFAKYQFQPIRKGQKIYQIYCPEIYADGWKYVRLIQAYPDRDDLTVEALDWFKLLGLTAGQIDSLKRSDKPNYHLTVYSDVEGYAVGADFDPEKYASLQTATDDPWQGSPTQRGIGFNEGLIVEAGEPLFKIVNLKSLRVDLRVRTEDVGMVKKGQKVIFSDITMPGYTFETTVSQIEPLNGGLFQWVKVFFTDPKGRMKPGRQVQGQILPGYHQSWWLPQSAVLDMGLHSYVFVLDKGRFVATAIQTGLHSANKIEVLGGIGPHAEVAENALLLIDSDGFIYAIGVNSDVGNLKEHNFQNE